MERPHNVVKEWKKSEFLTMKAFHISHNSNSGNQIIKDIFLLCWLHMFHIGKMLLLTWCQEMNMYMIKLHCSMHYLV